MPSIAFTVPFVFGKQRPRVLKCGRSYTPKETLQAERSIAKAYRKACAAKYGAVLKAPAHHEVHLQVVTRRPLPKSRPKRVESEPDTYKPDWDNIGKITDALNRVAWNDDAQITKALVEKRPRTRDAEEHMEIRVSWGEDLCVIGGR